MNLKKWFFLAVGLLLVLPLAAAAECNSYGGVTVDYDERFGHYCGGTGGGCTECYHIGTAGTQICVYVSLWDIYCTHYGPEYQWP